MVGAPGKWEVWPDPEAWEAGLMPGLAAWRRCQLRGARRELQRVGQGGRRNHWGRGAAWFDRPI